MRSIVYSGAVIGIVIATLVLNGCSTQQQQTALTVACTADALAPAAVRAGTTIAMIADPASVGAVTAVNAGDQALHPLVQEACASALAGSVPVAGTVNPVSVPVAPPVSQTTIAILPVPAVPK